MNMLDARNPEDAEIIQYHPDWHPCPLCGQLITHSGQDAYIDQSGKVFHVFHLHEIFHTATEGGHCFYREALQVPPKPSLWIRLLKWMVR